VINVECEILTAVVMKSAIFWDITPYSPLSINRRFGGTYSLHLQGKKISRARNQRETRCVISQKMVLWMINVLNNESPLYIFIKILNIPTEVFEVL
jgi:hypothetical protein